MSRIELEYGKSHNWLRNVVRRAFETDTQSFVPWFERRKSWSMYPQNYELSIVIDVARETLDKACTVLKDRGMTVGSSRGIVSVLLHVRHIIDMS